MMCSSQEKCEKPPFMGILGQKGHIFDSFWPNDQIWNFPQKTKKEFFEKFLIPTNHCFRAFYGSFWWFKNLHFDYLR